MTGFARLASAIDQIARIIGMAKITLALFVICATSAAAHSLDREQQRGKALLERMCARCHAVGEAGRSPHPDAPPFRTFSEEKLYDENFAQRLQQGLSTMHPDMPTFHFGRADAEAAANYLKYLHGRKKPQ